MTTARDGLQQFLDESTRDISCLKILEAGCGSRSNIRFGDCVHWVGIDISAAQLDRNVGLSEKIMDDVQVHEFEPSTFDMVVCWDVLEHLKDPEAALVRFAAATKPGGLIVLKIPNLHSLKGQLTKLLPHGFHVKWYHTRAPVHQSCGRGSVSHLSASQHCAKGAAEVRCTCAARCSV